MFQSKKPKTISKDTLVPHTTTNYENSRTVYVSANLVVYRCVEIFIMFTMAKKN